MNKFSCENTDIKARKKQRESIDYTHLGIQITNITPSSYSRQTESQDMDVFVWGEKAHFNKHWDEKREFKSVSPTQKEAEEALIWQLNSTIKQHNPSDLEHLKDSFSLVRSYKLTNRITPTRENDS